MIKYLLIIPLILTFFLAGCGDNSRPKLVISTPSQNVEITQPRRPAPLELNDVNFTSYTREELANLISKPEFKQLVGLTPSEFIKLAENLEDTAEYIEIQNAIISYYEETTNKLANKNDEETQRQDR